jgi:hypothetical protein
MTTMSEISTVQVHRVYIRATPEAIWEVSGLKTLLETGQPMHI